MWLHACHRWCLLKCGEGGVRLCGQVYALDASTGQQAWSFEAGGYVDSSPAVADGRVFIGCQNRKVRVADL